MFSKFFKEGKKHVTPSETADMLCSFAIQLMQTTDKQLRVTIDSLSLSEESRAYAYLEIHYVTHCLVLLVAMNAIPSITKSDIVHAYIDKFVNFIAVNYFIPNHYDNSDIDTLRYNVELRIKVYNINYLVSVDSDCAQSIRRMFIMILGEFKRNKDELPIDFLQTYVDIFKSNPKADMLKIPDFMPEISLVMLFNIMFNAASTFMHDLQESYYL